MKIILKHLTDAVCNNDEKAKDLGVEKFFTALGVDYEAAHYVAEQRAMRAVLLLCRGQKVPEVGTAIAFSDQEIALLDKFTIMFLDGLMAGVVSTTSSIKQGN